MRACSPTGGSSSTAHLRRGCRRYASGARWHGTAALYRNAATKLARLFRGAVPADLPIEQPALFTFVVNLRTARTLGLELPPAFVARADEVIE
jgi:hypothetical protein